MNHVPAFGNTEGGATGRTGGGAACPWIARPCGNSGIDGNRAGISRTGRLEPQIEISGKAANAGFLELLGNDPNCGTSRAAFAGTAGIPNAGSDGRPAGQRQRHRVPGIPSTGIRNVGLPTRNIVLPVLHPEKIRHAQIEEFGAVRIHQPRPTTSDRCSALGV